MTMPAPWKPPRIWEGNTAYIIGGGPSIKKQNLALIHNKRVIGVNNSYLLGSWVDICWWGDMKWLMWHKANLLKSFSGLVASCNTNTRVVQNNNHWCKFMRRGKSMGIDTVPGRVSWNRNSGCSAINLAVHLGVKRIVLLGFDMASSKEGETHWHGGHEKEPLLRGKKRVPTYSRFVQTTTFIYRDLAALGIEIFNTCLESAITVFPKVELKRLV